MGRTGSLGMEGIRRKLSEQYGRSPDPDEIAEEMDHDKGYGKKDMELREMPIGGRKNVMENNTDEFFFPLQSQKTRREDYSSDDGQRNRRKETSTVSFHVSDLNL